MHWVHFRAKFQVRPVRRLSQSCPLSPLYLVTRCPLLKTLDLGGKRMSAERDYGWMWLQALELSDQAERLQRRFLRYLGPGVEAINWEPPVDIHETMDGLIVLVALPGVAPEDIEVSLECGALVVSAVRRLRISPREAVIRRLEIPHGRFVRQLALPGSVGRIAESKYLHGCLEVRLVAPERRE
jgi:HSP20 family protein